MPSTSRGLIPFLVVNVLSALLSSKHKIECQHLRSPSIPCAFLKLRSQLASVKRHDTESWTLPLPLRGLESASNHSKRYTQIFSCPQVPRPPFPIPSSLGTTTPQIRLPQHPLHLHLRVQSNPQDLSFPLYGTRTPSSPQRTAKSRSTRPPRIPMAREPQTHWTVDYRASRPLHRPRAPLLGSCPPPTLPW